MRAIDTYSTEQIEILKLKGMLSNPMSTNTPTEKAEASQKSLLPSFQTYGNYSSTNYGAHALQFFLPGLTIWFSYQTPVAFSKNGRRIVRQNDWQQTTGKHLNAIDGGDKKSRVTREEFERMLREALA